MCLNKTYSRAHTGKHLYDAFPIQNGARKGDDLPTLLFNFALGYVIRKLKNIRRDWN